MSTSKKVNVTKGKQGFQETSKSAPSTSAGLHDSIGMPVTELDADVEALARNFYVKDSTSAFVKEREFTKAEHAELLTALQSADHNAPIMRRAAVLRLAAEQRLPEGRRHLEPHKAEQMARHLGIDLPRAVAASRFNAEGELRGQDYSPEEIQQLFDLSEYDLKGIPEDMESEELDSALDAIRAAEERTFVARSRVQFALAGRDIRDSVDERIATVKFERGMDGQNAAVWNIGAYDSTGSRVEYENIDSHISQCLVQNVDPDALTNDSLLGDDGRTVTLDVTGNKWAF